MLFSHLDNKSDDSYAVQSTLRVIAKDNLGSQTVILPIVRAFG